MTAGNWRDHPPFNVRLDEKHGGSHMRYQRPAVLTAAIAICVVNSLGNLALLPAPIPRPLVYASGVAALAGLAGVFGLWRLKRWGALVSAAVLALTALLAAPGIVFAPVLPLRVVAAVTVLLDIAGLVLIFQSASRRAYAPATEAAAPTR
jgi:uncharacterized membrane protein (DUF2068 family)